MQLPKRNTRRRSARADLVLIDFDPAGKLRGTDSSGVHVDIFPVPPASIPPSAIGETVCPLVLGKVPSVYLPGSVDDIQPYANLSAFPSVGESAIIYVALNDGLLHPSNPSREYRWNGAGYTEMLKSPGTTDALVEGIGNFYFTNARAVAALASTLANYLTVTAANSALQAASTEDRKRENHEGFQTAATISDFAAAVLAAVEASMAAMGTTLLADLPTTPPAGSADRLVSVQRSLTNRRRVCLLSDGVAWQFENGVATIDMSAEESADLVLTSSLQTFSTGTIVIPGKFIAARREFELEFDAAFLNASNVNNLSVAAGGVNIYSASGQTSMRRTGHVCRFFFNAAGNGFRPGAHLSGFGYGSNSGSGYQDVIAYTPGSDLTLTISALGPPGDTCRLWRWRLMGYS